MKKLVYFSVLSLFSISTAETKGCQPLQLAPQLIEKHCQVNTPNLTNDISPELKLKIAGWNRLVPNWQTSQNFPATWRHQFQAFLDQVKKNDQACEKGSSKPCKSTCFCAYESLLSALTTQGITSSSACKNFPVSYELQTELSLQNQRQCADKDSATQQHLANTKIHQAQNYQTPSPSFAAEVTPTGSQARNQLSSKRDQAQYQPDKKAALGKIGSEFSEANTGFWSYIRNTIGQRISKRFSPSSGEKYVAQSSFDTFIADETIQNLDQIATAYLAELNQTVTLTNDVIGVSQVALAERHQTKMKAHESTLKSLDQSLSYVAQICESQRSDVPCWPTGNQLPALGYPFGGGAVPEPEQLEPDQEVKAKVAATLATVFCPVAGGAWDLENSLGREFTGTILSRKGIVLGHRSSLIGFEPHEQGCIVGLNQLDLEERIYVQAEIKFMEKASGADTLFFLVPRAHYPGAGELDFSLSYPTVLQLKKEQESVCANQKIKIGTPLQALGFDYLGQSPVVRSWEALGATLPDSGKSSLMIDRQVRLTAGGGLVTSLQNSCVQGLLGLQESSAKLPLPEFVGWGFMQQFLAESATQLRGK